MTKTRSKAIRQPRLLITTQDHEIIASMIGSAPSSAAAMLLEDELDRAVLVDETSNTRPFCRIGSWVTYEDLSGGQTLKVRLVLPTDADIDKRWVSILSLVGASLLGLAVGAEFGWIDDKGRPHRLKVLDVVNSHDAHAC